MPPKSRPLTSGTGFPLVQHLDQCYINRLDGIERQLLCEMVRICRDVCTVGVIGVDIFVGRSTSDRVESYVVDDLRVGAIDGATHIAEQIPGIVRLPDGPD